MARFDVACKSFFSKPSNFADVINGAIFGGRPIINPADLEEFSTERLFDEGGKSYFVDVAKKWKIGGYNLLLIAIENQKYVDYSMVVRNMFTEALSYKNQTLDIGAYHDFSKDLTADEYLSKFSKKDMLTPIITVVIYFGEKPWDGPRTLYDMIDMNESLKPYIYNYKLNLIDYHDFDNFDMFQDEVRLVFDALSKRNSKDLLDQYIVNNKHMHLQTANLVKHILNFNINKQNIIRTMEGDKVDMCKALDEIKMDCVNEGISIGELKERERNAVNMIKDHLPVDKIMDYISISLDELRILSDRIGVKLTD